jgi:zinc protease
MRDEWNRSDSSLILHPSSLCIVSQPETHAEEFRRRPPAPLAPRPLNLPAAEAVTLPNGLRVLLVESRRLPLVTFRLAFRTGDSHDPADRPGLTDILAGMLNEGTETRTSRQIADEVARVGATLTAGASADYTTVASTALSGYTAEILELMADITLRPSFPEGELELAKQNTLQNLIAQRGQPAFLANERVSKALYGAHPYSVVAPTPESIRATAREEVAAFHRAMFIPNNAVLIAGGDFRRDEMLARVEDLFGAWPRGEARTREFPALPRIERRKLYLVDRPGSAQSNIVIANAGLTRTHPDYFPALVMHTILGGNASSRVFMNLREEKGYTYGAYTNLDARREAGSFRATAEVRTPVTAASLKEFFYEFDRIRDDLVTEKELTDATTYLTGIFPIRLETLDGLIDQLIQIEMLGLPPDYLQTYRERVSAVTREEVQRVARLYVTPERAALVVVGDAAALRDEIGVYAEEIELYDNAGRRKEQGDGKGMTGDDTAARAAAHTAGRDATAAGDTAGGSTTGGALYGTWELDVKTPFGQHPATLTLARGEGGRPEGHILSRLGDARLDDIRLDAESVEANVSIRLQGRDFGARLSARAEGDRLTGEIKVKDMPVAPALKFTGAKK